MEIELSIFHAMPKYSSTPQNYNFTKVSYSIIYNLSLSNEAFIHIFSAISKPIPQNSETLKHGEILKMMIYTKVIEQNNTNSSKTNWESCL